MPVCVHQHACGDACDDVCATVLLSGARARMLVFVFMHALIPSILSM